MASRTARPATSTASSNKTAPTDVPVEDFLATVPPSRADEARELIAEMRTLTGLEPVMWGPSIIGFGTRHYRTAAGREGDVPLLGFSPRKTALTVYVSEGFDDYGDLLDRLGRHRTGASCLYLPRMDAVDRGVLHSVLERTLAASTSAAAATETTAEGAAEPSPQSSDGPTSQPAAEAPATQHPRRSGSLARTRFATVEEYLASVPTQARPLLDELRSIVRGVVPEAEEVISYGLIGYRLPGERRVRVFVSGWKDHVAVYPLPKHAELAAEVKPFQRGRGTLWFPLDAPLPADLIRRVAEAMTRTEA